MSITTLLPEHWPAVKTIYEQGIATGDATFQTSAPAWEEWNAGHRGKKVGETLLKALIDESERHDIWTLQAGIFPENIASLIIHGHCGFREVGYREKIGKMRTGIWRDTVLMERRSRTAGID